MSPVTSQEPGDESPCPSLQCPVPGACSQPTALGWDTAPTRSQPPPPAPQSCHGGETVSASHSPPRAGTAPSSPHPCPAGWHRRDSLAQSSSRAMRCPDQGPRIARAPPPPGSGRGQAVGQGGGGPCWVQSRENLAPAAKLSRCQTEMPSAWWGQRAIPSPFPLVTGSQPLPHPGGQWRNLGSPWGGRWLGKGKREKAAHPRVRTPGCGHRPPGRRRGGKDPSGLTASPPPLRRGGTPSAHPHQPPALTTLPEPHRAAPTAIPRSRLQVDRHRPGDSAPPRQPRKQALPRRPHPTQGRPGD